MSIGISNSLVGLSLLSGTSAFSSFGQGVKIESAAVRVARAAFNLPETTPPWKQDTGQVSDSSQLAAIKRLASIIDKSSSGIDSLPDDVQTSFTAYKALDRLRVLAEAAAKATTSSAERTKLDALFAKGLSDLQTYLGGAPSDKLDLAFGIPTRRAESVGVAAQSALEVKGAGVLPARDTPIPGMTGTEKFTLTLTKFGASDTVSVDLAGTPQPPTLDSVADAINNAISAIPLRNPDGSLYLDPATGQPSPKWLVRFVPDKSTDKWGFAIKNPAQEEVAITQDNAADAILVAAGQTSLDAPERVRLLRFDDPLGTATQKTLGEVAGYDRLGTERALLAQPKVKPPEGVTLSKPELFAPTSASAVATAADGSSYVVGTTAGELDANRPAGAQDLVLTKLDSEGRVLWQRMLGAANDASGAAVSIDANGDVVVAGSVSGGFGADQSDGDMLVARYDASGDEQFATLIRNIGVEQASAVATAADGSIYVGGKATGVGGYGSGDAVIVKLDSTGAITERRTIDAGGSEGVKALAVAPDNSLIALTGESGRAVVRRIDAASLANDLSSIDLGVADARALAIAPDGGIAVGGATDSALSGAQVNGLSGGREGFVTRFSASLTGASTSYIGTSGTDQVDSIAYMNGSLYAGGRTTGVLGTAKTGTTDGFVVALDAASGAQLSASQFGRLAEQTGAVRISAASGGASALGAMGLARGTLTPLDSDKLTAQTSLREGDSFSVRLNDGAIRKISIAADDTMTSLAARIRSALGNKATVTTPTVDGKKVLRIEAKAGADVELIAGAAGNDALEKLGLDPSRLTVPEISGPRDPKVRPGGTYGLGLTEALSIGTAKDAAIALKTIKLAISVSQTAYRSLYWDSGKEALVNAGNGNGRGPSAYQLAQVERYQDALTRISSLTGVF
ncbi:MAG: hypothetical protein R3E11_12990 [Sphingobium sp.]|nr:hypothetical protein [Sphingobium sp.]MCP5399314.1 hypothetical protein [Sphingomonas sp.]